jgi:hypothetical protein
MPEIPVDAIKAISSPFSSVQCEISVTTDPGLSASAAHTSSCIIALAFLTAPLRTNREIVG